MTTRQKRIAALLVLEIAGVALVMGRAKGWW